MKYETYTTVTVTLGPGEGDFKFWSTRKDHPNEFDRCALISANAEQRRVLVRVSRDNPDEDVEYVGYPYTIRTVRNEIKED